MMFKIGDYKSQSLRGLGKQIKKNFILTLPQQWTSHFSREEMKEFEVWVNDDNDLVIKIPRKNETQVMEALLVPVSDANQSCL